MRYDWDYDIPDKYTVVLTPGEADTLAKLLKKEQRYLEKKSDEVSRHTGWRRGHGEAADHSGRGGGRTGDCGDIHKERTYQKG